MCLCSLYFFKFKFKKNCASRLDKPQVGLRTSGNVVLSFELKRICAITKYLQSEIPRLKENNNCFSDIKIIACLIVLQIK